MMTFLTGLLVRVVLFIAIRVIKLDGEKRGIGKEEKGDENNFDDGEEWSVNDSSDDMKLCLHAERMVAEPPTTAP
jgi:hypothetical protein